MHRRLALIAISFLAAAAPAAASSPRAALWHAEAALNGRDAGRGIEVTAALRDLATRYHSLHGADRRRARRLLERPTPGHAQPGESAYTVREHDPPFCSAHFCIHWVTSGADAPPLVSTAADGVPDYVRTMDAVFEHVYDVENGQLGWKAPKPDGARGCPADAGPGVDCMNKTDVYLKDIGGLGLYGYAAPDPDQPSTDHTRYGFLVMDDDYSKQEFPQYGGDPSEPLQVTAAHEYNHVLQYGYDLFQDRWMFESTATWMEEKVFPDIDDYHQNMAPWAKRSLEPLTASDDAKV